MPQLVCLVAAMQARYEEGFKGGFGRAGFHNLAQPTIDGRVIRWEADLGSSDAERGAARWPRDSQASST